MLIVKDIIFKLNNGETIFNNLSFIVNDGEKIALVGKNGIGKSTLLKIIVKELELYDGNINKNNINIAYFPQKFNEMNFNTVADIFGLEKQVVSLKKVENGNADIEDYDNLENHWDCVEEIKEKMKFFNLEFDILANFNNLSGGEKVKLILSSIINKNTNFLLLDEPTNNMDYESKNTFYNFIKSWTNSILLVSHDRELLNLVDKIFELRKLQNGNTELFIYGGNFDYYYQQKKIEEKALQENYDNSLKKIQHEKIALQNEKELKDKKIQQGKKDLKKNRVDKVFFGLRKMAAETSRGKIAQQCNNSIDTSKNKVNELETKLEKKESIYFKFVDQGKTTNKKVLDIENLNFNYDNKKILNNFNLVLYSSDKISITGKNGSGKTTLLKIISGEILNYKGVIKKNIDKIVYLDQEQKFLTNDKTILQCMLDFTGLNELECRNILAQFLFRTDCVYKLVKSLSGGEKMRLALAFVLNRNTPEILLLDEPTNNIDLESITILENILKQYKGAIVLISHDKKFKENIGIDREILLEN